jgi:cytochrome c peroxidase
MKKVVIFAAVFAFAAGTLALAQAPTYIGAQKCAMCHKSEKSGQQYPKWEASKHSKSVAALTSPQAADAARALGVANPATDPKCLKCHAPVSALPTEGVTCEHCHGAGSDYKSMAVMKDKAESAKKGLKLYANADAIKAQCLTCHENAHNKTFDFAAAWEKIKHAVPGK